MAASIGTSPASSQESVPHKDGVHVPIFADRVRERLAQVGLSASAASLKAGLGRDYIRDVLRNRIKEPGREALTKLSTALECIPEYLIGETDQPTLSWRERSDKEIRRSYASMGPTSTVPLLIRYDIRSGFWPTHHIEGDVPFAVLPLDVGDGVEQWLEHVRDGTNLIGARTLLHVIWPSDRLRSGAVVVVETTPPDSSLTARGIAEVELTFSGVILRRSPLHPGEHTLGLEAVLTGNNPLHVRIVGHAVRGYSFLTDELSRLL